MQGRPTGMISPATGAHELVEIEVAGVRLDVCPATGGIWFDRGELQRFDEAHEAQPLLLDLPFDPSVTVDATKRRRSPRAPEVVMMRQGFGADREIEVDICPATGGIWLDRGELQRIHERYPTAADRERAARQLAATTLASLAADQKPDPALASLTSLARFLRWLSPSYHRKLHT